ncbi:protein phosphatase CheZ [Sneathiella sp. CAU 1612]|jgi:chemotaxis protein CheZ|uniref:Protein phosphatase CheZ n=1 Tax=Sneathiella sedimenti TaxID=2816034 RepID=A0ABS3F1L0_9PROT|nr:protein phosphatase CheZ [Sneathiella sedimenti]MBO0332252.1 protein phosphatase CheZ [Sneathiella sedimenti]
MPDTEEVIQLRKAIASLHQDCQDLANFIMAARSEIAQIRPNDLKQEKLPRAGKELDAIVEATETATNQIMTATEKIMSAKVTDADVVNDACMEIFEACSFQDITGQRISKVVNTLNYIEDYLARLTKAWGHQTDSAAELETGSDDDSKLLNGPALAGEGVNQGDIDTLFDEAGTGSQVDANTQDDADKGTRNKAQDEIDALFD